MKRFWPKLIVVGFATLIVTFVAIWRTLGLPVCAISSFEFVNGSDRVVSNLDLDFIGVSTVSGNKIEEYSYSFSRHFTNVPPACSVTVESRTPALMLMGLHASHRPRIAHLGSNVFEGPYSSSYRDIVTASPGKGVKLCFASPGEITRVYAR